MAAVAVAAVVADFVHSSDAAPPPRDHRHRQYNRRFLPDRIIWIQDANNFASLDC